MIGIEQRGDSVTIRGGAMVGATFRAVLLGIRARRYDGLPSADLQELALAVPLRADDDAMLLERHDVIWCDGQLGRPVSARLVRRRRGGRPPPDVEAPDSTDGPRIWRSRSYQGRPDLVVAPGAAAGTGGRKARDMTEGRRSILLVHWPGARRPWR